MQSKIARSATSTVLALVCGVSVTAYAFLHAKPAVQVSASSGTDQTGSDAESKPAIKPIDCPIAFAHDFGKVEQGVVLKHSFRIINTCAGPLWINGPRFG